MKFSKVFHQNEWRIKLDIPTTDEKEIFLPEVLSEEKVVKILNSTVNLKHKAIVRSRNRYSLHTKFVRTFE